MNENQETIARALEIAITLTDAKDTWLRIDENNNVIMEDKLLRTVEIIIKVMNAKNLINICDSGKAVTNWVYPKT